MTPWQSVLFSGSTLYKAVQGPDMPRRQKKETDTAGNDALTLLRLQQQVLQLTRAKAALDVQKLVHETALYNFTSAQDRRTLNAAQSCLNSLRIRIEAQVNTVEETVKQRHGWLDWNGQTLGVYHYGYFTLNKRDIQYHGPTAHPSDQTAVLEWGLGSPFTLQDKPPLAIAMLVKSGDIRKWKRYRLVVARKEKLHLDQRVSAVLEANTVTSSGFFPCSISREYLYGYATDGYRSPLWLCAAFNGSPTLVHARSGYKVSFHSGVHARQLVVLSGIHYFDAHRLLPEMANRLDLPMERRPQAVATEGGHEAVSASETDNEEGTTDAESTAASDPDDPAWCPPIPTREAPTPSPKIISVSGAN